MSDEKTFSKICGGKFAIIPSHVLEGYSKLPSGALWLYAVICRHADAKTNIAWRSNRKLARQRGVTVRTIQRWRRRLEQQGLLVVKWRPEDCNLYVVVRDPKKRVTACMRDAVRATKDREQFEEWGRQGAARKAELKAEKVANEKLLQSVGGDTVVAGGATQLSPKEDTFEEDSFLEEERNSAEKAEQPRQTEMIMGIDCGKKAPSRPKPKPNEPQAPDAWQRVASKGGAKRGEQLGAAQQRWLNELSLSYPSIVASLLDYDDIIAAADRAEAKKRGTGAQVALDGWRSRDEETAEALNGEILSPESISHRKCDGGWACVDGCRGHQHNESRSWAAA